MLGLGGLRARIVAALVVTDVLTLVVTGVALLGPLDRRLRNDAVASLHDATLAARPGIADVLRADPSTSDLERAARSLRRRTGGEVAIFAADGHRVASTDPDSGERFTEAATALRQDHTVTDVAMTGGQSVAGVATPVRADGRLVAVAVRKRLDEAHAAVVVVRHALIVAAVVGLLAALAVGVLLAGRLVRRLTRLRTTAQRVAELGPVVEMHADPARDEVGDLSRTFATMHNRLRDQEQARRTFVATASHELRTPLASLRLMLSLLREDLDGEPPALQSAREQAERADAQAEALAALADDLLQLSRIDAGVALRHELVELGELCRSVVAEFEPRAAEAQVRLQMAAASRWAIADPGSVARIVRILLDNALGHVPAGGRVAVEIPPDGPRATVSVVDDGPGVADDVRDALFERFTRGSDTGDRPGFGLGLAIGRELARRMGGELELAADRSPGAGFRLTLEPAPSP
ncbi:MAG: HAMP domain-containing protein [Actinobacteria bacterium]|nr:MAG: HAMP domain-containing protein [Actinomycetota bacterium]